MSDPDAPLTWTRHRYYLESSSGHLIAVAYMPADLVTFTLTHDGSRTRPVRLADPGGVAWAVAEGQRQQRPP